MNVLITGDSHVISLRQAHITLTREKSLSPSFDISFQPLASGYYLATPFFIKEGDYALMVNEECRKQFKRFPPDAHNYDWVGISGLFHTARIGRNAQHWRMFSPWQMPNGKHAVSTAMLRQAIESDVTNLLEFIEVVRITVPVFVIEAPWPFKHHPAFPLMGEELVHFLHQQYRNYVMDELERRNIPVVTIDPSWIDADGFMDGRFRHDNLEDTHHGNLAFGRLMLERVTTFLAGAC